MLFEKIHSYTICNLCLCIYISEFCGNLTKISKTNSVGSTIQLLFIPNEPNYNMEWFHWTGTKYQRLDKHNRSKYEETIGRNNQLFVFKISKSTKSDEGFYKAHCGSGAYSNIVLLNIGKCSFLLLFSLTLFGGFCGHTKGE